MTEQPRKVGFAAMSPERQRELASRGGKAAHEKGTAYEWNSQDARIAGRKGGLSARRKNLAVTQTVPETTTTI